MDTGEIDRNEKEKLGIQSKDKTIELTRLSDSPIDFDKFFWFMNRSSFSRGDHESTN
jgi:hypothetical protein